MPAPGRGLIRIPGAIAGRSTDLLVTSTDASACRGGGSESCKRNANRHDENKATKHTASPLLGFHFWLCISMNGLGERKRTYPATDAGQVSGMSGKKALGRLEQLPLEQLPDELFSDECPVQNGQDLQPAHTPSKTASNTESKRYFNMTLDSFLTNLHQGHP